MTSTGIQQFIASLISQADTIRFEDTMAAIDGYYDFTPSAFKNGDQLNEAGENSGSCKILAFGQIQQLTVLQTLILFGQHYRDLVLYHSALISDHSECAQRCLIKASLCSNGCSLSNSENAEQKRLGHSF